MSPNGKKSTQVENHQHGLRVPNCSNFTPYYLLNHQKKLLYTRPLWNRFSRKPAKETPLMNPVQCLSKPVSTDTHTQSKLLTTWPFTQSLLTSGLKEESRLEMAKTRMPHRNVCLPRPVPKRNIGGKLNFGGVGGRKYIPL